MDQPIGRFLLALLIAPLVPGVVLEICSRTGIFPNSAGLSFAVYTYWAEFVVGVPVYLAYEALGLRRLYHYLVGGFMPAFLLAFALLGTERERQEPGFSWSGLTQYAATMGSLFASATGAFWLMAVRPMRGAAVYDDHDASS
jgi:hypothetical protein